LSIEINGESNKEKPSVAELILIKRNFLTDTIRNPDEIYVSLE